METRERVKLHKILRILALVTFVLLAFALYLGTSTARYMKTVIRDQFNQQQLILAKTIALRIEANIQNAYTDLTLLNSLSAVQYGDAEQYESLLVTALPVLTRDNLTEIRRVDRAGNTIFVVNDQGVAMHHFDLIKQDAAVYLSWAADVKNRGKIMGAGLRPKEPAKDRKSFVLDLIIPTYETSTDKQHPRASLSFAGYLRATFDVSLLLQEIVTPIRSGKTGYAWVLDSNGTFLYHPESSFVGENAFTARFDRDPHLSFTQINDIMRNEMLKGKEGMGAYISGWHRDVLGPMEKLIAYVPMRIQGPYSDYTWSVAVVAPVDEIEGVVNSVYGKQILLQGIIIFLILAGSVVVLLYELRWSTILEHEVAAKTEDIRGYAEELRRSEGKYRSLVENAEDLIFTLNADGIIKTANRHMSRLLGVAHEELTGQSLYRFLPHAQADEQLQAIRQVLHNAESQRMETLFRIQETDFWFNIQYIPVKGEGEESPHILAIARDITERKSFEKQLINTEKLASLGTLAAGVAHEINNPIGIMLGFCDLLLEKMEPGTMEYNDLKTIERHGLHCKSIVERLLSFARITEDAAEEDCDLNANIEEILSVTKHTLGMNNIQLLADLAEGLPRVRADCRGLQQVLLNLINNAVYAMNGRGTLTVKTGPAKKPGFAQIVVTDTGCGIRREFLQKIFDPFFTTKKVGEGTGLGLSVSYGIITKYGGAITCESCTDEEKPGHSGTSFTLLLPFFQPTPT